jgi:3-mercaptopyruvate sulfurtransferase SseA
VALRLRRVGITRVRPLAGGFEAWRRSGLPLEPVDGVAAAAPADAEALFAAEDGERLPAQ